MLLVLAGTACLVMTVATSLRAAGRRLRYESWHLLHLYAYLGVGLALPHQLWTGQEFLTSTAATVFWWSLWALAAGAVLVWRVGLPLWRNARHRLRVTAVVPEAAGVVSAHLTGRHLDRLPAQAGQFLTWRFLHRQGWTRGAPPAHHQTGAAGPVASRPPAGIRLLARGRRRRGRRRDRPHQVGARPGRARRVRMRPRGGDRDRAPRHPGGRPPSGPAPYREVQVVTWR